jgi:hypothetical protein
MLNGYVVDIVKIAEESGCDVVAAHHVAIRLLEALHKSALLNHLSGSLLEVASTIGAEGAYHVGGIYTAIGDEDLARNVSETMLRLSDSEDWKPLRERMKEWEEGLTEKQQYFVQCARDKDY